MILLKWTCLEIKNKQNMLRDKKNKQKSKTVGTGLGAAESVQSDA